MGTSLDGLVNALNHVRHIAVNIGDIYLRYNSCHTHHTIVNNCFLACLCHILSYRFIWFNLQNYEKKAQT